jgi:FkbM family methyltransferase
MADTVSSLLNDLESDLQLAAERRSPDWLTDQLQKGAYVYGAGAYGRRVARALQDRGFPCLGMIDRRPGSGLGDVDGLPVLHPAFLTPCDCWGRAVVMGVFNPFNDMGEIVRWARGRGFAPILWGADLPDALGPSVQEFWLSGRQLLVDQFHRIRALADVLADPTSVATLAAIIRFRALDGDDPDPVPSFGTQYLPADLPRFDRPIRFLDGGAYDGDTYRSLTGLGVQIAEWIAFEPDPANYARLISFGRDCGARATFVPCGLSDRLQHVPFAAGNDSGSRILEDRTASATTVQCLALDDAYAGVPLDYVKLDIEGAEGAALTGMAKTVQASRPRMAISAYHRPQDLWEIPLQLAAMLPDSDIHLRQHFPNTYEVVAYAIPRAA